MFTDEDLRRLLESRHDLAAAEKATALSPLKTMQSAIATSRDALHDARAHLQTAAHAVLSERGETDAERAKLEQALTNLNRRYAFVRVKVQDALLNIDPEINLDASEIERRSRLVDRIFKLNPTDLGRLAQADLVEFAQGIAHALENEPDLKSLGFHTSFASALDNAKLAAAALRKETTEDAQAMNSLRAARDEFDRIARAHALLIESILVRHNRLEDLGQFILARNAAYAARRAARAPIGDEPGAANVDAPVAPPVEPAPAP